MLKKWLTILAIILVGIKAYPQTTSVDSVKILNDKILADTSLDYDDLFNELDSFLDSLLRPHSYFMASIYAGNGYYNYDSKDNYFLETTKQMTYVPVVGYYHKSGMGITISGNVLSDSSALNLYQGSVSPSYDYIKNRNLATGIAYTRFFTKDSLTFYTSPLQNELYAYFTYRKWWLKPSVSASYGWGSRSSLQERERLLQSLRLRLRGYTRVNTTETINDFSVIASVRHDFYWLDIFGKNDHIRLTPQISFTCGTQKFGFNQQSSSYATATKVPISVLYSSQNIYLDDQVNFQPLSITAYIRSEYGIGKFFFQPQLTADYYFPATDKNLNFIFSFNAGVMF